MNSQSAFPKLFSDYHAIHEAIDAILRQGATTLDPQAIERQLRETHPDLEMGPATLAAAIKAAIANTPDAPDRTPADGA